MTFTFNPRPGGRIRADIATAADGPHVWLSVTNTRGEHAAVFIPLTDVEVVVAGIREAARQAGGPAPETRQVVIEVDPAPLVETIRDIVRRGPGPEGMSL